MVDGRVLIVGLGDLGRRLAVSLGEVHEVQELVLAGRDAGRGKSLAQMIAASGGAACRFAAVDALHLEALTTLVAMERPTLIVQCASLLSPWELPMRADRAARALCAAGFAVQLPAQLPIIMTLMRAVKAAGLSTPVVNCSYPDVTHAVLARLGLAPAVGIGNVGMIAAVVAERARVWHPKLPLVRVIAHHAHVRSVLTGGEPCPHGLAARIYLGEEGKRADDWATGLGQFQADRALNGLSADHGCAVIRALLAKGEPLRTSAPGPFGLQGGFPVRIGSGRVELDLPRSLSWADALEFQARSATLDGVAAIGENGRVSFTMHAREAVATLDPELAAPLDPDEVMSRYELLMRAVRTRE